MKAEAAGALVHEGQVTISADHQDAVARAIGTPSAVDTASLVPFFGPTVAGEGRFQEVIGLDLSRALLGGIGFEWERPFRRGETVGVKVFVDKVFDKGANRFGIVIAEFRDGDGVLIQRQSATFIERSAA